MKSYDIRIARTVEEVHRVRANSREDALENWDTDGERIERDEEHSETTAVLGVKEGEGAEQCAYSVLLAYPEPNDNGEPETYYCHVYAGNVTQAILAARQAAVEANIVATYEEGRFERADFYPLLVLAGHVEAEAYGGDQNWKEEAANA